MINEDNAISDEAADEILDNTELERFPLFRSLVEKLSPNERNLLARCIEAYNAGEGDTNDFLSLIMLLRR